MSVARREEEARQTSEGGRCERANTLNHPRPPHQLRRRLCRRCSSPPRCSHLILPYPSTFRLRCVSTPGFPLSCRGVRPSTPVGAQRPPWRWAAWRAPDLDRCHAWHGVVGGQPSASLGHLLLELDAVEGLGKEGTVSARGGASASAARERRTYLEELESA